MEKYINEDYCSEEITGLLQDKGYVGSTNTYLDKDGFRIKQITLQSAMKWLREVHSLEIYPYHDFIEGNDSWWFEIIRFPSSYAEHESDSIYNTYEEACEAAIKYCLENLI